MLIENGTLRRDALAGQVAVVTGAGRGIGFETVRALLWLGANVIIAEIDEDSACRAEIELGRAFDPARVAAIPTDVADEASVQRMADEARRRFGKVDIVINNATVTPFGPVWGVPIAQWDRSYGVNLRGPVLLAQQFVPGMLERDDGVFVCVSSVGEGYMGGYECYKAAQVHLANTLNAELEGTNVHAFTIGPGLVRTPGADAGIAALAPFYGMTVDQFYEMSRELIVTAEEAGTGFAAAVALAAQFRGQEIDSRYALAAAGIRSATEATERPAPKAQTRTAAEEAATLALCRRVLKTLEEQSAGWSKRSFFERQWMFRDFNKNAGMPVERWLEGLAALEDALDAGDWDAVQAQKLPVDTLARYYTHLMELAKGYEKDPARLAEQMAIMQTWTDDARSLAQMIK